MPITSLLNSRQLKKIRTLWRDLNEARLVRDSSDGALSAFVKRKTGVDSVQQLNAEQACDLIIGLKRWLGRSPSN